MKSELWSDQLAKQLEQELAHRARSAQLLDVSYDLMSTPIGELFLAATPLGLVRVAFTQGDATEVLADIAAHISPRILRDPQVLAPARTQLADYFAGRRTAFDLVLDEQLTGGFRQDVQRLLPQIPYGQTRSYRDLAEQLQRPQAVRAVGTACAKNPILIVVPCHRVLRSDGTLGGYAGGLVAKKYLLELEAA